MPLDVNLRGELVHVGPRLGGLGAQRVDIDGLHGAVQLSDLLLQRHGLDEPRRPLTRCQGSVLPGKGVIRQDWSPRLLAVLSSSGLVKRLSMALSVLRRPGR